MRNLLIILSLFALLGAAPASARPAGQGGDKAAPAVSHGDAAFQSRGISLEEAVRRVRRQYDGRIVSAETRGSGERRVHVIKVLTKDGRVRTVRIPAN